MTVVFSYDQLPSRLMVELFVEGGPPASAKNVRALIDTGADFSCIQSDLAFNVLELDPVGDTQIQLPAASAPVPPLVVLTYNVAFSMVLEDGSLSTELGATLEMAALQDLGSGDAGEGRVEILLGMDFLKTIKFDYNRAKLDSALFRLSPFIGP